MKVLLVLMTLDISILVRLTAKEITNLIETLLIDPYKKIKIINKMI
jgi:hypothetical protein